MVTMLCYVMYIRTFMKIEKPFSIFFEFQFLKYIINVVEIFTCFDKMVEQTLTLFYEYCKLCKVCKVCKVIKLKKRKL